MKIFKLS